MKTPYKKTLFIFHRDLRLDDNNGLRQAIAQSKQIIPCFIFDPRQIGNSNSYKGDNAIQFMVESLIDLDGQLYKHNGKLYIFNDTTQNIVEQLIIHEQIDAVFCNKDYTPFSRKRDEQIESICKKHHVHFEQFADALLNEPETIKTKSGLPYAVFTPFYRYCSSTFPIAHPISFKDGSFYTHAMLLEASPKTFHDIATYNPLIKINGGSTVARKILNELEAQRDYLVEHDYPSLDSTTHLSAHLKFGTISVRQVYHAIKLKLGNKHPLLRQLYWRDFFYHVAYNNPTVFGHAYHEKYDELWWENGKKKFELWRQGKTGFPIVDAGMRELNATGYMHNRARMIAASFLVKDLHIDWRWGEKYFAQKLVDYDPAVNNGNWQWAASTGCDAQPYFRIFNPWLQQAKFDPECIYIKQWIPELETIAAKTIHTWYKTGQLSLYNYPRPIVDHAKESALAKQLYKKC